MFERLFGGRDDGSRDRRTHPARPVQDRQVPGAPLRIGAPDRPHDLGLQGLRRGRQPVHPQLGRVQGTAPEEGPHRHPLRDPLDEARHRLGGRPDPGDPATRPGPADGDARRLARRAGLHGERAAQRPGRRRRPPRRHVRRARRWSRSTATRSDCSSRSGTSGRAASGSAASSSSTTTSSASGSATATTTTPIPGRKSASASSRPRPRRASSGANGSTRPPDERAQPKSRPREGPVAQIRWSSGMGDRSSGRGAEPVMPRPGAEVSGCCCGRREPGPVAPRRVRGLGRPGSRLAGGRAPPVAMIWRRSPVFACWSWL